jgi:hypothetical protein
MIEFRQALVGLACPTKGEGPSSGEGAHVRDVCQRLLVTLARRYEVDKDRKMMWAHIRKAVTVALTEVQDADTERLFSRCLEEVKADPVMTYACPEVNSLLLGDLNAGPGGKPESVRLAIISRLRATLDADITHARARWMSLPRASASKKKEGGDE